MIQKLRATICDTMAIKKTSKIVRSNKSKKIVEVRKYI